MLLYVDSCMVGKGLMHVIRMCSSGDMSTPAMTTDN
jgi:hypothetical protein